MTLGGKHYRAINFNLLQTLLVQSVQEKIDSSSQGQQMDNQM